MFLPCFTVILYQHRLRFNVYGQLSVTQDSTRGGFPPLVESALSRKTPLRAAWCHP